jgi:methionine-gamma-lyase
MDKRQPSRNAELGLSTRAIHHGYDPAEEHGALTPPIFMTSTYAFETAEAGSELFRGERAGYIYGRTRNPTQALLESRLASLEGGEAALAVASGMGAISATMWTLLSAGDSVVIDRILYGNTFAFFTKGLTRFGVNVRLADFTDPDALAQALAAEDRLKLVYFETPANPNLRIIDMPASRRWPNQLARLRSSTTPSRPRFCKIRSSSALTSSFIRRRNILAAMAICLAARSSDRAR